MAERLLDELAPLGEVTAKRMFGGYGVFEDGVMFALVDSSGGAFLRADETTSARFEEVGSEAHGRMPYWRIPPTVLDDSDSLVDWATMARDVARVAKRKWPHHRAHRGSVGWRGG